MQEIEIWKDIPGWEQRYQVSNLGHVRTLRFESIDAAGRRRVTPARARTILDDSNGYPYVILHRPGHCQALKFHKALMLAFVGPCPRGLEVRHLNGDASDCRLSNLRYGTHAKNCQDIIDHGNHHELNKTRCPAGHEYDEVNTKRIPSRPNARYCRACHRARRLAQRSVNA